MFLPILSWEVRHAFRQRWFHNLRRVYGAIVLLFFGWYCIETLLHASAWGFMRVRTFWWLTPDSRNHLLLTILFATVSVAPILGVVGITQARNQRTIELLLSTRQTALEIVLSYWLASWFLLVALLLPAIPLLLWLDGLTERPVWTALVSFCSISALALPLAAWSILMAITIQRTAAALVASYLGVGALWTALLAGFRDRELNLLLSPAANAWFWQKYSLLIILPSVMFLGFAMLRLRRAFATSHRNDFARSVQWHRPAVGDEPIFWRDYYLKDWLMLRFARRIPYGVRIGLFVAATCFIALSPARALDLTPHIEMVLIAVGFPLMALAWSASSISTEREQGTWDLLRVTELSGEEFIEQTLRAILPRLRAYWTALLPAVVILTFKRGGFNPLVPICWFFAMGSMYPAAVIGLYYSVHTDRVARGILSAISALAFLIAAYSFFGFLTGAFLIKALSALLDVPTYYFVFFHDAERLTMMLVLATACWLVRVFLVTTAQFLYGSAVAYLTQHEGMPSGDQQRERISN